MMMSSNGDSFRVTDPLCGEFTAHYDVIVMLFIVLCEWLVSLNYFHTKQIRNDLIKIQIADEIIAIYEIVKLP